MQNRSDSIILIYLKAGYTIIGKINSKQDKLRFSVPLEDTHAVIVEIFPDDNRVESFLEIEVSEEIWNALQTNLLDAREIPEKILEELRARLSLQRATQFFQIP